MSAGTATAATTNDTTINSVADQIPVDRLDQTVDGVKTAVENLTGEQQLPERTDRAGTDREGTATAPDERSTPPAKDVLDAGVDRLSKLTASLEDLGNPARDIAGAGSVTSDDLAVAVPASAQVLGDVAGAAPSKTTPSNAAAASTATTEAHRPGEATRGQQHTTHADESAVQPSNGAGTSVDGPGGGELPLPPVETGAFGKTPASGSAAGSSVIDGGTGARVTAFHLPFAAQADAVSSLVGVEGPWNSAGKPRVSPD
ncbi:MAG: hypothetical protein GEV07_30180 [Streptosporangiales bacterium]|nr:hypothetical protein [Streptosporangiales bacterium]